MSISSLNPISPEEKRDTASSKKAVIVRKILVFLFLRWSLIFFGINLQVKVIMSMITSTQKYDRCAIHSNLSRPESGVRYVSI